MTGQINDVIVYGVNGYTGKLIAESLHKRGIAFTAAGRNEEKIKAALAVVSERVGGEIIDASVAVVDHTPEALTELFTGATVVINVTGPFAQLGEVVVKASLEAGCHYIDTTGEQDFMIAIKAGYDKAYAEKGLVLAPACSYMWTMGALAAETCLETPGIDSLDLAYLSVRGVPSVASTRSFMRVLALPQYFLEGSELKAWELGKTFDTVVEGSTIVHHASPWGGAAEPIWYQDDPRVQNCRVVQCGDNDEMIMITAGVKQIIEQSPDDEKAREAIAISIADTLTQEEPEKEDPLVNRSTVTCRARGSASFVTTTITLHSAYVVTGELIAEGCQALLGDWNGPTGFTSPAVAFDHKKLLKTLADAGYLTVKTS